MKESAQGELVQLSHRIKKIEIMFQAGDYIAPDGIEYLGDDYGQAELNRSVQASREMILTFDINETLINVNCYPRVVRNATRRLVALFE